MTFYLLIQVGILYLDHNIMGKGTCDNCGFWLVEHHYKDKYKYCPRCGSWISPEKRKEIKKTGILVTLPFCIILVIIMIIGFVSNFSLA